MREIKPPQHVHWVGQRIVISLKAAFFGWLVLIAFLALMLGINLVLQSHEHANGTSPFVGFLLIAAGSGFTVFVVWIVVLIPLALIIPDHSVLWNPRVLTAVGAIAGPLVCLLVAIYNLVQNPTIQPRLTYLTDGIYFPGVPSAIIGGVTGAVAARLHSRTKYALP